MSLPTRLRKSSLRYDAARLPLKVQEMNLRKEKEIDKVRYLTQYASQNRRCRSLVLQEYFGEDSDKKCGVCDVCLKEKREASPTLNAEQIRTEILAIISGGVHQIEHIRLKNTGISKEDVLKIIREMTDEGILKIDKSGHLFISGK